MKPRGNRRKVTISDQDQGRTRDRAIPEAL
jgi:hypothetical protein